MSCRDRFSVVPLVAYTFTAIIAYITHTSYKTQKSQSYSSTLEEVNNILTEEKGITASEGDLALFTVLCFNIEVFVHCTRRAAAWHCRD